MRNAVFLAGAILAVVLVVGAIYLLGRQTQPAAVLSPTATATSTATASTTPSVTAAKSSSPARTVVFCGTFGPPDSASGQGGGADTLRSPKNEVIVRFAWVSSSKPQLGTYLCARFEPAVPILALVSLLPQNDPDYLPASILTASTAEMLADALGDALEASDYTVIRGLIDPDGFIYQLNNTGGSTPITPDQAVDRFKRGTTDGQLRVTVKRRPIGLRTQLQPDGDRFITSTWLQYDGKATQGVDLILKTETGRWFWRSALFGTP